MAKRKSLMFSPTFIAKIGCMDYKLRLVMYLMNKATTTQVNGEEAVVIISDKAMKAIGVSRATLYRGLNILVESGFMSQPYKKMPVYILKPSTISAKEWEGKQEAKDEQ